MCHIAQERWEELRASSCRRKGCRRDCSLFSSRRPEIQSKETSCSVFPQEEGFHPLGRGDNRALWQSDFFKKQTKLDLLPRKCIYINAKLAHTIRDFMEPYEVHVSNSCLGWLRLTVNGNLGTWLDLRKNSQVVWQVLQWNWGFQKGILSPITGA